MKNSYTTYLCFILGILSSTPQHTLAQSAAHIIDLELSLEISKLQHAMALKDEYDIDELQYADLLKFMHTFPGKVEINRWQLERQSPAYITGDSLFLDSRNITKDNLVGEAKKLIHRFPELFNMADSELILSAHRPASDRDDKHYVRFNQFYKGTLVWGGNTNISAYSNGRIRSISCGFVRGIDLSTKPKINLETAIHKAEKHLKKTEKLKPETTRLIIFRHPHDAPLTLCWQLELRVFSKGVFVNAYTGEIILVADYTRR